MQVALKRRIAQPAVVPKPRATDAAARPRRIRGRVVAAAAAGALLLTGIGAGTAALVTMSGDLDALRQQVTSLRVDIADLRTEEMLRNGQLRFQNEHLSRAPAAGTAPSGTGERFDEPR